MDLLVPADFWFCVLVWGRFWHCFSVTVTGMTGRVPFLSVVRSWSFVRFSAAFFGFLPGVLDAASGLRLRAVWGFRIGILWGMAGVGEGTENGPLLT